MCLHILMHGHSARPHTASYLRGPLLSGYNEKPDIFLQITHPSPVSRPQTNDDHKFSTMIRDLKSRFSDKEGLLNYSMNRTITFPIREKQRKLQKSAEQKRIIPILWPVKKSFPDLRHLNFDLKNFQQSKSRNLMLRIQQFTRRTQLMMPDLLLNFRMWDP